MHVWPGKKCEGSHWNRIVISNRLKVISDSVAVLAAAIFYFRLNYTMDCFQWWHHVAKPVPENGVVSANAGPCGKRPHNKRLCWKRRRGKRPHGKRRRGKRPRGPAPFTAWGLNTLKLFTNFHIHSLHYYTCLHTINTVFYWCCLFSQQLFTYTSTVILAIGHMIVACISSLWTNHVFIQ